MVRALVYYFCLCDSFVFLFFFLFPFDHSDIYSHVFPPLIWSSGVTEFFLCLFSVLFLGFTTGEFGGRGTIDSN